MKPTKKNAKKLSLRKQTVRTLSAEELANAQGGLLKLNWGLAGGDDTTQDTSYQTTSATCSSLFI
jgi:hypothetical protein